MKALKEIKEVWIMPDEWVSGIRYYWEIPDNQKYGFYANLLSNVFKSKSYCKKHFKQFCKLNGIDFSKIKIKEK